MTELDRWIAEKVMEYTHRTEYNVEHTSESEWIDKGGNYVDEEYTPSTDVAQALQALDTISSWSKMHRRGDVYICAFFYDGKYVRGVGDTRAKAICLALKQAKEG